jgi:L-fucose isomerase-like protein
MSNESEVGAIKNLGVLIFARKRPGFDQEWSKTIRERCLKTLTGFGFTCIGTDRLVQDDESVHAALDEIERAECDALVIVQPSIADGQFALTIAQRWSGPIVLWATPERPGDGKVSSCSLVGQHLWASICRQSHQPFEMVYGGPELADSKMKGNLLQALAVCSAAKRLRQDKVGVIGTHVPGFIDLAADPFLIRNTFGLQMHSLSLPQFIDRVRGIEEQAVREDIAEVRRLGLTTKDDPTDEQLAMASRYFLAMKDLMREMNLDALALQCWPELPIVLGQWPYLAVSRMTTAGNAVSIEGDVDGAIGSLVGCRLGIGPGFLTDWLEHDAKRILFWHPGMAPLDMCSPAGGADGPSLGDHFNGMRPFVVNGPLKSGHAVTVSRLWRCDGRYHLTAFEGQSVAQTRRISGNSLLMEVSGETVPARFDRLIHAGLPHHVTLHYGNHADTFRRLAQIFDVEWHG